MYGATLMSASPGAANLNAMTTMTPPTQTPPPPPPPPPTPPLRRLQRSTADRVAGGVAGGLGDYFGLDPVLFRVLFAVASFFGGFGLIAYGVLWLALPDAGDPTTSSIDKLGTWLREHRVPLWAAIVVAVIAFWVFVGGLTGFHGFFPGAAVVGVVLLIVALGRRGGRPAPAAAVDAAAPTVSLSKPFEATDPGAPAYPGDASYPGAPAERPLNSWFHEAREAGRRRRRRARPIALGTLAATVLGLATVGVIDAVSGVALPVYAVVGGSIVLAGALLAAVLRRPAYSLLWLLIPPLVWLAAFGGTHVSLRDGAGDRVVRPTSAAAMSGDYRQAFGRLTLDLRGVYATSSAGAAGGPSTVTVRVAAGVARVIVPADADVTVRMQVRSGAAQIDGSQATGVGGGAGWRLDTVVNPRGSDGPPLTVILQVTDGTAQLVHP